MALGGVPTGSMKSRLVEIPTVTARITGLKPVDVPKPMAIGRKMPALVVLLAMTLIPRPKTVTRAVVKSPDLSPVKTSRPPPMTSISPETSSAAPRLRPPPIRRRVPQLTLGMSLSSMRPVRKRMTAMMARPRLRTGRDPDHPARTVSVDECG